ncbi:unnamed protein product [Sphagnum jensenii]
MNVGRSNAFFATGGGNGVYKSTIEGIRPLIAVVDNLTEDEDTVAYHVLLVHMEPISYLAMDVAYHIMWSGHKDGKVRGELWVGSESGFINVWPCEATFSGLVHGQEDEIIAALFFARLCVPLRGLIIGNNLSQTELYFLVVAEDSTSCMWAKRILYIIFEDARTKEAMRVFGASVHSEPILPNLGLPHGTEIPIDERASRKESGFEGWFQRSKNVFLGARDAIH